jgi:hemoglobin
LRQLTISTNIPADLTNLKRHQAALLTQVLGGSQAYEGRDLSEAHRALAINPDPFHKVAFYLVGTLWELGVPMDIVLAVGLTVLSLKDAIVQPSA